MTRAGKYIVRLADASSRNVVQVLSADGTKPYDADSTPTATAPAGRNLEGEVAPQAVAIASATTRPARQQARASLPNTASATPLWLLGGLGFLAAAGLVRRLRTSRT